MTIYCRYFSQKDLNHIRDLFENNGKMKSWEDFGGKLELNENKLSTQPLALGKKCFQRVVTISVTFLLTNMT